MTSDQRRDGRGLYLAIDGPDGVGKSTLWEHAAHSLAGRGLPVAARSEPERAGPLWPAIRDHRLSGEFPDAVWVLVLAAAAVAGQGRLGGTLDLLRAGTWVVTDRSPLSLLARYWRSAADALREPLLSLLTPPDLLVLLLPDDPDLLRRRLRGRGEAEEHIDGVVAAWEDYEAAGEWLARRGWPVFALRVGDGTTAGSAWEAVWERLSALR